MFEPQNYSGNPVNFALPDGTPLSVAAGFAQRPDGRIVEAGGQQYNGRGQINAYDDRDHDARIKATADLRLRGKIKRVPRSALMSKEDKQLVRETLRQAAMDRTNAGTMVIAGVTTDRVYEVMEREGLSRNLLATKNVGYGEWLHVPVDKMDVMAFLSLGNSAVAAQEIEQDYIIPQEADITCLVNISHRVLAQADPDLLDKKYKTMLQAFGVTEDRMLKHVMDLAAPSFNNLVGFSAFTPSVIGELRQNVGSWGLTPTTMLISYDLLNDMWSDPDWTSWYDQGMKHQLALEGFLETIGGLQIVVDGFRYENIKVLEPGEVYMMASPATFGVFTEREKLQTESINAYNQGRAKKGWFGFELISHTIVNGRALCKGIRQ